MQVCERSQLLIDRIYRQALCKCHGTYHGGRLPVEPWVRVDLDQKPAEEGADALSRTATKGLSDFIGHELEFAQSPVPSQQLLMQTMSIALYFTQNGHVFADGQTTGAEPE